MVSAIKAVVFDFGGVVIDHIATGALPFVPMAEYFGVSVQDLRRVAKPCFDLEYAAGLISYDTMWKILSVAFGKDVPDNHWEIAVERMQRATLRYRVVSMIDQIKTAGFHVYLLSDMTKEWRELFEAKGWYNVFEDCIHSCDVGMTKAMDAQEGTTRIFDYALQRFGFAAHEILFLDDKQENIDSALRAGMHVIHVVDEEQLVSDLSSFLGL